MIPVLGFLTYSRFDYAARLLASVDYPVEHLVTEGCLLTDISGPYKGLDSSALGAGGFSPWSDGIFAHRSGNDECFGVVYHKWLEGTGRTFHNSFPAFYQIQYIQVALCMMCNCPGEPVTVRLDELGFIQSGPFGCPAISLANFFRSVQQVFAHPLFSSVPVDVFFTVANIDGSRQAVESQTAPVPQLESEDIRSGTDFQYHTVFARAVDGASGNKCPSLS